VIKKKKLSPRAVIRAKPVFLNRPKQHKRNPIRYQGDRIRHYTHPMYETEVANIWANHKKTKVGQTTRSVSRRHSSVMNVDDETTNWEDMDNVDEDSDDMASLRHLDARVARKNQKRRDSEQRDAETSNQAPHVAFKHPKNEKRVTSRFITAQADKQ
jgi:hypothetical protein